MRKVIAFVAVLFILFPYAEATVSLGSLSDSESIIYSPLGSNVQLKYSFFNTGDENLNLVVSYVLLNEGTAYDLEKYDARIHLMHEPYPSTMMNSLYLTLPPLTKNPDSSQAKEWIALNGGTSYAEAMSAYLLVQIPKDNIHANPYRLKVVATTADDFNSSGAQNMTAIQKVVQQREYDLTIYNGAEKVELVPDTIDSDNDGLTNSEEINIYKTNPYKSDTDGDGIADGDEIKNGTDPNDPDSPRRTLLSPSYLFGKLQDIMEAGNGGSLSTGADTSGSDTGRGNANGEGLTDTGEKSENIGETDETDSNGDEKTGSSTGLVSKISSGGSMNIATVIILIVGTLFAYRLLKTKVH